jgi:hypothetical protein
MFPAGELDERPRFFREAQEEANAGANGFGYFYPIRGTSAETKVPRLPGRDPA